MEPLVSSGVTGVDPLARTYHHGSGNSLRRSGIIPIGGWQRRKLQLLIGILATVLLGATACHAVTRWASAHSTLPVYPLYRIPVRVHIGVSNLTIDDVLSYLAEVNRIWRSQAAICFEFEVVRHNRRRQDGFDLFYVPDLAGMNGFHYGDHNILVRDVPILGSAPRPAATPGARTTAHEFGHGLGLAHNERSDDLLMRSARQGFQLRSAEIRRARRHAAVKALADTTRLDCDAPMVN